MDEGKAGNWKYMGERGLGAAKTWVKVLKIKYVDSKLLVRMIWVKGAATWK